MIVESFILECYSFCIERGWGSSSWVAFLWGGAAITVIGARADRCLPSFIKKICHVSGKILNSEERKPSKEKLACFKERVIVPISCTLSILGMALVVAGFTQGLYQVLFNSSDEESCVGICKDMEEIFSQVNCSFLAREV